MNSKQIEGFLHVAKTRNITKSAKELFFTAPTLSRNIAQMEEEFGFPLFERGANSLRLTPAGEIMFKTLASLQRELYQAIAHGQLVNQTNVERITVGALHFFNREFYLQKYFEAYMAGNAAAEIQLTGMQDPSSLRPLLDNGTLDICFHTDRFHVEGAHYQKLVICPTSVYALIGTAHPQAQNPQLTFKDLDVEVQVTPAGYIEPGVGRLRSAIFERYDMPPSQVIAAKSRESQSSLIRLGKGYVIRNSAYTQRGDEELIRVPIDVETEVYLVATWRKDNPNHALQRFISVLEQVDPPPMS